MRKRSAKETVGHNFETKRRCLSKKNSSKWTPSKIEDLPVELWWRILSYVDGESIYNSFNNLNGHIDKMLFDPRFSIHLSVNHLNQSIVSRFDQKQIYSLRVDYHKLTSLNFVDPNRFARLRCLSLVHIEHDQLQSLSRSLTAPLNRLSIESNCAKYLSRILLLYFPTVSKINLDSNEHEFLVKLSDREINVQSAIERLFLRGQMKLAKFYRLSSLTPKLRSFAIADGGLHQADYWLDEHLIRRTSLPSALSNLRIRIFDDDLSFTNLEHLVPKTLESLSIFGSTADDDLQDYLSSDNWRRLISRSSCQKFRIRLDLSSYFDPGDFLGLQRTLSRFRNDAFFRHVTIRSKQFFVTVQGSIENYRQI